jgi:Predicted nucleic acid-binding protein, contains PIN domain
MRKSGCTQTRLPHSSRKEASISYRSTAIHLLTKDGCQEIFRRTAPTVRVEDGRLPPEYSQKKEEQLLETLDPGESQALAVAEDIDGTVVTDDGDARATAKQRDIDLTGSIGLLVRFVEDQQISVQEADQCLKQWIDEGGFRSPARDFEAFLEE